MAKNITVTARDFSATLQKLLKEYGEEVNEVCRDVVKEVAQDTVKELKRTSPVGPTGKYAKGWALKPTKVSGMLTEYVVHNKRKPGLTHLLENSYSRPNIATAKVHIAPAEETAIKNLEEKIREGIESR